MSYRYFIFLSYKGTAYFGWQTQPDKITVQGEIQKALSVILQEEISVTGAGRTDTGVHARLFVAHFDSQRADLADRQNTVFRLNCYLPKDISIERIRRVSDDAHARFNALSRTYRYYISSLKDSFNYEYSWFIQDQLDINAMNEAATFLMDYEDFTSFSKLHTDVKTNNCKLYDVAWTTGSNGIILTIRADRFLRNMVRAIVGTMVDIGSGKNQAEIIKEITESKNRNNAGKSAPAAGLFLEDIEYDERLFLT